MAENASNRIVITVLGKNRPGIVAGISRVLGDENVDIRDITQSIIEDIFTMTMIADISAALEAHELVKITVLRNASDEPRALIRALSSALGVEEVSVVGSKLVLYRRSTRDGVAHIEL